MIARWMIAGFVLWAIVIAAFRFVGHQFFTRGDGVAWLFMILPVVMFAMTFVLIKMFNVDPSDRAEAASIFAVPGMLIGIYVINSYALVFPNLDPNLSASFASLMFACYAGVIICGIVSSRLQQMEKQG
jgi:hypothetical protein